MLRERVTPARLHPLVRSVPATTERPGVLRCVGLAAATLLFALREGDRATQETPRAPCQAYGRWHVHGISLETAQGHAHIEGGYADQHLRVTVQVGEQPAQHRRLATMEQAQAWAEEQLR